MQITHSPRQVRGVTTLMHVGYDGYEPIGTFDLRNPKLWAAVGGVALVWYLLRRK